MNSYSLVILPGDGAGQEVMEEVLRVFKTAERAGVCEFRKDIIPCAGSYYVQHQKEWPDGSFDKCKAADAIMLGAIGHLDSSGKPIRRADGELAGYEQVIGLRMKLDLYANVRPVRLFPGVQHHISSELKQVWDSKNVDMVIIRENTEGAYTPGGFWLERAESMETVISSVIITRRGAERVARRAFEIALLRKGAPVDGVTRVTCVDKSNVLRSHRFFRDTFRRVGADYPKVELDFAYIDAFCQALIRNPECYDVVVAPNLPGDVITDLGAVLQGGMGMAASANIGDNHAMFEPIHGSAPDCAGQNVVNPIAAILSTSLMFEWLGKRHNDPKMVHCGKLVDEAIGRSIKSGEASTRDLGGQVSTTDSGSAICRHLSELLAAN